MLCIPSSKSNHINTCICMLILNLLHYPSNKKHINNDVPCGMSELLCTCIIQSCTCHTRIVSQVLIPLHVINPPRILNKEFKDYNKYCCNRDCMGIINFSIDQVNNYNTTWPLRQSYCCTCTCSGIGLDKLPVFLFFSPI